MILVCIILEMLILFIIYGAVRELKIKRSRGVKLIGKKLGFEELPGTPTRYILTVEYVLKGDNRKNKLVTTDKAARKFAKEEAVPLIYVENANKLFWEEETDSGRIWFITIMTMMALLLWVIIGMLILIPSISSGNISSFTI